MKKNLLYTAAMILWAGLSLHAQNSVQVVWPCDSVSTTTAVVTGSAAAAEESFSDMIVNSYNGLNSSQRLSPLTGGGWPNERAYVNTRYVQFSVSPSSGKSLYINTLAMTAGSQGGNNLYVRITWAADTSFTNAVEIFNKLIAKGVMESVSAAPAVMLQPGQSFYIRVNAYYDKGSSSGKYLCLKDITINGSTASAGQPVLSTSEVVNILTASAQSGGNIVTDGGSAITARGICWSTLSNPTTADNRTIDGSGTGAYTSQMNNLQPGTQYHVRAYAVNSNGTFYADEKTFSTLGAGLQYSLGVNISGLGSVQRLPSAVAYNPGDTVTLTAIPGAGYSFFNWSGDISGRVNPIKIIMNSDKSVNCKFIKSNYLVPERLPVGFAAASGQGLNITTGGAGGDTVYCLKGQTIADYATASGPRTIIVTDTVTGGEIKNKSNISVIGLSDYAAIKGMAITNCSNIIVRNLTVYDSPDGIRITTTSSNATHHVWIDHCSFTDDPALDTSGNSHDGSLDITHRSSYITVSWCHFWNHRKTCLLGFSASGNDGETEPNQLMVTYHHNWFDRSASRHPRARWAPVHVFNNLYSGNNIYGVGSACGAKIYVEKNYFDNVPRPVLISGFNDPDGTLSGDPLGYAKSVDNYSNTIPAADNSDASFTFNPSAVYSYLPDSTGALPDIIKSFAGAGRLDMRLAGPSVDIRRVYSENMPEEFRLYPNYPNPFNPATNIRFALPSASYVTVEIFSPLGRQVDKLEDGLLQAGVHSVEWNAARLASGVYFIKVTAVPQNRRGDAKSIIEKSVLLK